MERSLVREIPGIPRGVQVLTALRRHPERNAKDLDIRSSRFLAALGMTSRTGRLERSNGDASDQRMKRRQCLAQRAHLVWIELAGACTVAQRTAKADDVGLESAQRGHVLGAQRTGESGTYAGCMHRAH